ncbi:MAG: response regulator [Anaerolineae bacterium]|jgi:CheY-like chemotaxis protein
MGNVPSILIVDSNIGFASMLQQSLEQEGEYRVTVTHDGAQALEAASIERFDLAIVDLGVGVVASLDGISVARRLREGQADLRLMLIPLTGDALPQELVDLDVQGTLSKPFFLPDLADLLETALSRPVSDSPAPAEVMEPVEARQPTKTPAQTAAAPGSVSSPQECSPQVLREMESLARELDAATVLLTRGESLLGSAGRLRDEDVKELAAVIADSYRISGQAAEVLGHEEQHAFEQSVEGDEQVLYSLSVVDAVILSVALSSDVALGMLRHRARTAAKRIRDLMT